MRGVPGAAGVERKGGGMSVCDILWKFEGWRRKERSFVVAVDGRREGRLLGLTARGFVGERGLAVVVEEGVGGMATAAASVVDVGA